MFDCFQPAHIYIRAFKSCRRADACLCKIFNNLRKMCNFERKIGKTGI